MNIQSVSLKNFGSYKSLEFDFSNQGLTLIQGATGAGKSTLMDAIPWVLFGHTAKGGKVDEVRNWSSNGTTEGTVKFGNNFSITRIRGTSSDLYFSSGVDFHIRGKDIGDTQKQINEKLGIALDLYLSGAYFHEFSQTAQFFTTSAKSRRDLCEQLVDLGLANRLQDKSKEALKALIKESSDLSQQQREEQQKLSLFKRLSTEEKVKSQKWEESHARNKVYYAELYGRFEENRRKTISRQCPSCHTVLEAPREVIDESENPYAERLIELEKEVNPYTGSVKSYQSEINEALANEERLDYLKNKLNTDISDFDILADVLVEFRSRLVRDTIQYTEKETNELLLKYFDGELSVSFHIENDKLEVAIQKDGNNAVFTQLSKGQRQLLKLCFSVAVMKAVSNHHGVKFHQIFLDEALDGLSDALKVKAFSLFQAMSQEWNNVFVIDHSESLKALFDNQYKAELVNGDSQICHL